MSDAAAVRSDLDECAREPIHIPGSIQPHGYLFVLNEADLSIAAVSRNAADMVGVPAMDLVGKPIGDVLLSDGADDLQATLTDDVGGHSPRVRFRHAADAPEWDATVHRTDGLVLLALGRRIGAGRAEALLAGVDAAIERIRTSRSLGGACETLAREIRNLTGFDRVMIYRFDPDWNGEVIAEDKTAAACSYLGHSFPASDIPAQARALYTRNAVRLIPDAGYVPSPIVPAIAASTGRPIDLSLTTLRSVSPVHLEYLANMGVAASMSVSIVRDGTLWGLAACHHARPHLLETPVLQACQLLAQATAWYLDAQDRSAAAECLDKVRQIETELRSRTDGAADLPIALASVAPALLAFTRTQGLALSEEGGVWTAGQVPPHAQILALVDAWLPASGSGQFTTRCLPSLFPPAEAYRAIASGVAARRLPGGWLVWFRAEWPHTLTWAGERGEAIRAMSAAGRINPRKSFAAWRQAIKGQSRPWTARDLFAIDATHALLLRTIMAGQVRRLTEGALALTAATAKAEQANRAKTRFLAHVSHELRTPLHAILGFSELLCLGDHAAKAEEYGKIIHDSGQHLLALINDILDLSKIEAERWTLDEMIVDFRVLALASIALVSGTADIAQIGLTTDLPKDLPRISGDERTLKQILLNLISNAVKFTRAGGDVVVFARVEANGEFAFGVRDTGVGIPEIEQQSVFDNFGQGRHDTIRGDKGTGLGLSIVRGLAIAHGGRVTLTSRVDVGTCVTVFLPASRVRGAGKGDRANGSAPAGIEREIDTAAAASSASPR